MVARAVSGLRPSPLQARLSILNDLVSMRFLPVLLGLLLLAGGAVGLRLYSLNQFTAIKPAPLAACAPVAGIAGPGTGGGRPRQRRGAAPRFHLLPRPARGRRARGDPRLRSRRSARRYGLARPHRRRSRRLPPARAGLLRRGRHAPPVRRQRGGPLGRGFRRFRQWRPCSSRKLFRAAADQSQRRRRGRAARLLRHQ